MSTSSPSTQRHSRTREPDADVHAFAVGDNVRLKGGFGDSLKFGDTYAVTATLPARGGALQYRIRNLDERYERMASQHDLEPAVVRKGNAQDQLIERTFG